MIKITKLTKLIKKEEKRKKTVYNALLLGICPSCGELSIKEKLNYFTFNNTYFCSNCKFIDTYYEG